MCAAKEKEETGFGRLEEVSKKRSEWATLPVVEKLAILEEIQAIITNEMKYEDWNNYGKKTAEMMGFDTSNTVEGGYEAGQQSLLMIVTVKKKIDDMIFAYKIRAGLAEPPKKFTKGNYETRTAINGQIVMKTFPIFPGDSNGLVGHMHGEVWMDSSKIQDESQVEAFAFDKAWENAVGDEGGLMVVLGAGNHGFLTVGDIVQAMYTRNYVVYTKQHPIRTYANDIYSRIFAPLISRGYLAIEAHTTIERSSAIIFHPDVDALHITGGKATHDLLVWGADPKERERNLKANTPKIKNVTSELGAVSPWVVVPGKYTKAQMKSQAGAIANFVHNNASCNCNAPKSIVVADDWDQKDEFLQIIEDELVNHPLPVAYYPNIEKRWQNFADQYPDCKKLESNTGMGIEERGLSAGGLNEKPLLLPILQIEIKVDLESDAGKEAASKEFVFNNEPFAPVYTIATLEGTGQKDLMKFVQTASVFCNDYLFGTLSASITTPPSLLNDDGVQTLIAEMKYGCLCVNYWGGIGYFMSNSAMWGAFPGETIDAVQSGIGKCGNVMAIPHFEKCVLVSPITHRANTTLKEELKKETRIFEAVSKYVLDSTTGNLIKMISALVGVDLIKAGVVCTSVMVAGLLVVRTS